MDVHSLVSRDGAECAVRRPEPLTHHHPLFPKAIRSEGGLSHEPDVFDFELSLAFRFTLSHHSRRSHRQCFSRQSAGERHLTGDRDGQRETSPGSGRRRRPRRHERLPGEFSGSLRCGERTRRTWLVTSARIPGPPATIIRSSVPFALAILQEATRCCPAVFSPVCTPCGQV